MTGRRLHPVPSAGGGGPAARTPGPATGSGQLLRVLVGQRLRRARTARGRTLRDVAAAAGVSIGHLSQVERGLAEASSEVLAAVCRALGLPLAALLRAVVVDLTVAGDAADDATPAVRTLGARTSLASAPRAAGARPAGRVLARAA